MRRMNNLVTFFTAITAFFFGSFITKLLIHVDECPTSRSGVQNLEPHPDLFLIILVLTAPNNVDQRQTIRETWLRLGQPLQEPYYPENNIYLPTYTSGGHLQTESVTSQAHRFQLYKDWEEKLRSRNEAIHRNIKVKHFFAIGMYKMSPAIRANVLREQGRYNDLLLLPNVHDSYETLTEKLLHSLDALTHNYKFSYLIKVDDDTYVKLDKLLNELVSYDRKLLRRTADYKNEPLPQLYWGFFNGFAPIKTKGKWREHNYYLSKHYITYALGGGYVISRKLCEFITNNSHGLSPYMAEDISMGTWLAPLRYVYRWHDIRFDTAYMARRCRSEHLVLHKRNERMMRELHSGQVCDSVQTNNRFLPEYYYDWSKQADKCCDNVVI